VRISRTAWHTHPRGQREGGPVEVIRPAIGSSSSPARVTGKGATPNRFMAHLAMQQNDESGSPVTWREHVTDQQYSAAPTA
jgi:hypothetical protein